MSIKPALTPDEWGRAYGIKEGDADWAEIKDEVFRISGCIFDNEGEPVIADLRFTGPDRHAVAALALHGEPFGFTHEDVDLLRVTAKHSTGGLALHDLADRMEALLSPR